jgi:hypothetical protein
MNKLILATSIIGLALVTSQAEAGSHKNLKSKPPQTACDCSNCSSPDCPPPPPPNTRNDKKLDVESYSFGSGAPGGN